MMDLITMWDVTKPAPGSETDFGEFWKVATTLSASAFGIAALFAETKNKTTNKITWLGIIALVGIGLSAAGNLWVQHLDTKKEADKRKQAEQDTAEQLRLLNSAVNGMRRAISPITSPLFDSDFLILCPKGAPGDSCIPQKAASLDAAQKTSLVKMGRAKIELTLKIFENYEQARDVLQDFRKGPPASMDGAIPLRAVTPHVNGWYRGKITDAPLEIGPGDGTITSIRDLEHSVVVLYGFDSRIPTDFDKLSPLNPRLIFPESFGIYVSDGERVVFERMESTPGMLPDRENAYAVYRPTAH